MTELLSIPWYFTVVPVCAVVGAIIVSKVFHISQLASLLGAALPLGLPYAELSVSSNSLLSKPPVQILGGWVIMLALVLLWVITRTLLRVVRGPIGLLRVIYSLLLGMAGLVVVLLVADPKTLHSFAPTWRESFGGILLATTGMSVAITMLRVFRLAAFLVLSSVATAILATQVFFEKMPYDLKKDDLQKIERALPASIPKGLVKSSLAGLLKASSTTRPLLRPAISDDIES